VYPVLFHIGALVIPSYGVFSALGILLGLALLLRTARIAGLDPNQLWNLCIVALFAALVGSRLLLVALNWTILRSHPAWLLGLAMVHHPLLAAVGSLFALAAAVPYARRQQLTLRSTADALAAPLCLGLAFEQIGALLAGSGYGRETDVRWAVVYTDPLAARWSGTPLFLPVHPVQGYAACAFLIITVALLLFMSRIRQEGDILGAGLMAISAAVYFTEFWRDSEGRGTILHGALDGPQWVAIVLFLAGAFVLRERPETQIEDQTVGAEPAPPIEAPHE
jgi:phosphatidylglycerol:prolipoprotein diacylglycerol transferase